MKKITLVIFIILSMLVNSIAFSEGWECSRCGNSASGNFCNNCGISAESSLAAAHSNPTTLMGQTIYIDNICEFVIEEASFIEKLVPENPAAFYQYYKAEDGKKYLSIKISYVNLESDTVSMNGLGFEDDLVKGELTYAGRYKYRGFLCFEDRSSSNGNTISSALIGSIDPLCKATLYYLIEVPNIVYESTETVSVVLTIAKNEYSLIIR